MTHLRWRKAVAIPKSGPSGEDGWRLWLVSPSECRLSYSEEQATSITLCWAQRGHIFKSQIRNYSLLHSPKATGRDGVGPQQPGHGIPGGGCREIALMLRVLYRIGWERISTTSCRRLSEYEKESKTDCTDGRWGLDASACRDITSRQNWRPIANSGDILQRHWADFAAALCRMPPAR
jgi:hypothetical protein